MVLYIFSTDSWLKTGALEDDRNLSWLAQRMTELSIDDDNLQIVGNKGTLLVKPRGMFYKNLKSKNAFPSKKKHDKKTSRPPVKLIIRNHSVPDLWICTPLKKRRPYSLLLCIRHAVSVLCSSITHLTHSSVLQLTAHTTLTHPCTRC